MADALEIARTFLASLHRFELAMLLDRCSIAITTIIEGREIDFEWYPQVQEEVVQVFAPSPIGDALEALPHEDRKRIAEAVANGYLKRRSYDDIRVENIPAVADGIAALLAELIIHRSMMTNVSTGGTRIQEVNDYYIAREARIRERIPADVKYVNPHDDLWAWYKHWNANFGSYAERRQYLREMFNPSIAALARRSTVAIPEREPTGFDRVDRAMGKARSQFELASAEEDYQAIGLLCREVIISLAQAVFDPEIHETLDGVTASATDANRMLEAYIGHVFPGGSNKEVRAHARASLALALNLQHRRTATKQLAALCVEATASTTAVISIIAKEGAGGLQPIASG
jgi:hypothetical protein